ncbi:hypothetical protein [Streptomyces sp. NPDC006739]|uniref:hypothetical protein n=1 Tax=Streptomyces sp. NPDC006739 TaxID=3364763 RepID=UPI003678145B
MEDSERSRRGRTTALITGAAVLGVVAGTCTGYLVQVGRPPTKLASLSQPVVRQAKGDVEPLSAAQDRRVKTDGDLRKLLLKRPGDARDTDFVSADGWMDLADYADTFEEPDRAFGHELESEFRRAAEAGWRIDGTYVVDIRLVQYRQVSKPAAAEAVLQQQDWAGRQPDTSSRSIPGTGDGMAYVHHTPKTKSGYLPEYTDEATASRGDIEMEIWITDTKPVPQEKIMELAKRQVGRL